MFHKTNTLKITKDKVEINTKQLCKNWFELIHNPDKKKTKKYML